MIPSSLFPVLILGYGNIDRQDDGVAWHVLNRLANRLHLPVSPDPYETELGQNESIHLVFQLQLFPELSETLLAYSRVCFLDAHTGAMPENLHFESISALNKPSPFTHHLTPQSLLSLTQTLSTHSPEAVLLSIRGYEFGFSQRLSVQTESLVDLAVEKILSWLQMP